MNRQYLHVNISIFYFKIIYVIQCFQLYSTTQINQVSINNTCGCLMQPVTECCRGPYYWHWQQLMPDESNLVKRYITPARVPHLLGSTRGKLISIVRVMNRSWFRRNWMGKVSTKKRLIATPQRMIVPPSEFQSIRLLWPVSREKERYYRVRLIPVMPGKSNDFGLP